MKLKYYLRGLGIGIVVTAIIISFTKQPEKLTDEQIKMRALELGMVEESVLADLHEKEENVSNDKISLDEDLQKELNSLLEENSEQSLTEEVVKEPLTEEKSEELLTEEVTEEPLIEESSEAVVEDSSKEEGSVEENIIEDNMEMNLEEAIQNKDVVSENGAQAEVSEEVLNNETVENFIVISVESGNNSMIVSNKLYEAGLIHSVAEYNRFLVNNGYDRKIRAGNHEIPVGATEEEMAQILCEIK